MRKKSFSALLSVIICLVVMLSSVVGVVALEDKYTIDELSMSIKIPKEYTVITRTTERSDEAFSTLSLDYDETMTAFYAADIYLQSVSDDGILKVTLTQTSDENSEALYNYSDLSTSERSQILDAFMASETYTSGVEIKHNGNIYFDLAFTQQTPTNVVYGYQCHTVINGMNINLTLQKNDEALTADEIKVVTNIANTISFKKITHKNGPSFDWWRIVLWIVILIVIAILANYLYRQYNFKRRNQQKERRTRVRVSHSHLMTEEEKLLNSSAEYRSEPESTHSLLSELGFDNNESANEPMSFDELLGYDTTDYHERANTEMESFDINVKSKDKKSGVSFFEDDGKSINDKADYFEDYFKEDTESRPVHKRFFSSVVLNVKLAFLHLSYFFRNLYASIFKKNGNNRKKK